MERAAIAGAVTGQRSLVATRATGDGALAMSAPARPRASACVRAQVRARARHK